MIWGYLLIIISAMGFGLIPIFASYAYDNNVSLTTLLFLRFTFTSIILFTYIFIKKVQISITRSQLFSLILLGGVLYTLQSTFYFTSIKYIPASLAVLLLYLYPVFVAILSFFVNKEQISIKLFISIAISLTGMILILGTPSTDINFIGVILALGAAITYSIYIIYGNKITLQVSPIISSAFIALFASVSFLIGGLSTKSLSFDFEPLGWVPILGTGLFSGTIAMLTFFKGMNIIGPTRASILSMVEPVVTIIFSIALFNDKLTGLQFIGAVIIILGAVLVILFASPNKKDGSFEPSPLDASEIQLEP